MKIKKKLLTFLVFLLCFALTPQILFADCRPCPYTCETEGLKRPDCKDFKNKKGKCCVRHSGNKGAKIICGTDRRCTDKERKKRGCKDYKNEKGQSCIEFQR